jgi:virulence-associated protein VagC
MKRNYSSLLWGLLLPISYIHAEVSLVPPNAKAGECYAKVVIPAKYKAFEEKVLIQEASEKISIIPAKYQWNEKKVEITPESKKLITVPARYKTITKKIEVKPSTRSWHINLKPHSAPVSKEILVAAKIKGVDFKNSTPGSCFKEYYTTEKYKIITEKVVIQEERTKNQITPAKYEMIEKTIEIKPASKKTITIPASYEYKEDKILVEKAKTVWKKGINPAQKLNGATGEIMCLVKVPAKYKIIKKKVVKTPASTKVVEVPAVTKTFKIKKLIAKASTKSIIIPAITQDIEKKVLDKKSEFSWIKVGNAIDKGWIYTGHQICLIETPSQHRKISIEILETNASVKEVVIAPSYKTIKVKQLVEEAKEIKTPIQALYKTVAKREKISDAYQSWERILCQTNMNKEVIMKIQNALKEKNYQIGKIDGVLGRGTRMIIDKYQRDNSLATGGITYETLKALNVEL